jgi:hypothetical protein
MALSNYDKLQLIFSSHIWQIYLADYTVYYIFFAEIIDGYFIMLLKAGLC